MVMRAFSLLFHLAQFANLSQDHFIPVYCEFALDEYSAANRSANSLFVDG